MAKAGRKRKAGRRQANGQIARSAPQIREAATIVVRSARMRLYGLSADQAKTDWAGYEVGRMALMGLLGPPAQAQKVIDTVTDYMAATADYMRIKCPQMPMPKAMNYLAGRGMSLNPDPSLKTVDRIVSRYETLMRKLSAADAKERMIFHEVAFHDRAYGKDGHIAVINCASALRAC